MLREAVASQTRYDHNYHVGNDCPLTQFNIRSTCSIPASSTKVPQESADRAWHNTSVKEFAAMGLKFPRHSWLFSLCLHCYALLCCTQMWESAACLWVDCIANKSERWPVMLTLGNADAPAGKISRVGNHRHVTHTLIDCKHTLPFCHVQDKDQNKEEKLLLSYPLSLVQWSFMRLHLQYFIVGSRAAFPQSPNTTSRPKSHIALSHAHSYWWTAFMWYVQFPTGLNLRIFQEV